uniref:Uncharacterized protein n=1 Tax=uncultured Helicobacter sp. TaxID=175537 RepID=A0A650EL35_9HELI|nr:hypothetical protein Helico5904_1620 [uncultured Helicobacter sp.]
MGYDKNTRKKVKRLKKRGRFIETEIEETLQDFLPFKPIINDVEHNKKVFGLALYELLPYKADIGYIAGLFDKHFSTKLSSIDDDVAEYRLSLVLPLLKQHFSKLKFPSFLNKNFKLLREYFGLSELEIQILMLFSIVKYNSLFDEKCTYNEVLSFLSSFFCTQRSEVRRILTPQGKLRSFGFLQTDSWFQFEITNFAGDMLSEPLTKKEIVSRIARICPKSKLSYADFAYMKKDLDMLLNYCQNSTNPSIFLYGKPGVGKK